MSEIKVNGIDEDEQDHAAWDKALANPASSEVLKRLVAHSMKGPFSPDLANGDASANNDRDDDELH